MGPGGIFGNIRGASKYLTMSNVVASRNIDLLCIRGRDFYTLLKVILLLKYCLLFLASIKYSQTREAVQSCLVCSIDFQA
jgi:hypothetical protein